MLVLYLSDGYLIGMAVWLVVLAGLFFGVLWYRRKRRAKGRGLALANLGLSVCMLLGAVTAAELAFACCADFSDTFNITNVSKRWLLLHIDHERNNENFRDRLPFTKYVAPDHKRIIFLGDSFTIGHGVKRMEDRFTDRIAAWLDEKAPGKYVVANLGEPGFEASQVESIAAAVMSGMHADVSMFVYVYNLNDIEGYMQLVGQDPLEGIYTSQPTFFLFRDTYLLNWLYFRFVQFRARNNPYFDRLAAAYHGPAWDGLRAKLSQLHRECKEGHTDFRMVIFPFLHDLTGEDTFRDARARIVDFCKSEQIPVLDLEPVLREHAGENLMVSRFDGHPNERAHAIAAEAIEKNLLSDLVPAKQP
ncbi:MAG TPA: SGNH/GDSL hydrolase family protein [Planctomycetaceae bacterium]|nr:SGNH/GDSL hydrolase family protein [Planctomycetaceae bacterium]